MSAADDLARLLWEVDDRGIGEVMNDDGYVAVEYGLRARVLLRCALGSDPVERLAYVLFTRFRERETRDDYELGRTSRQAWEANDDERCRWSEEAEAVLHAVGLSGLAAGE